MYIVTLLLMSLIYPHWKVKQLSSDHWLTTSSLFHFAELVYVLQSNKQEMLQWQPILYHHAGMLIHSAPLAILPS